MELLNYNKLLGYMYGISIKDAANYQKLQCDLFYRETGNLFTSVLNSCEFLEEWQSSQSGRLWSEYSGFRKKTMFTDLINVLEQLYVLPDLHRLQVGIKNKRLVRFRRVFTEYIRRTTKSIDRGDNQYLLEQEKFKQFYSGDWQQEFLKSWCEQYIAYLEREGEPNKNFVDSKSLILNDLHRLLGIGKNLYVLSTIIRIDTSDEDYEVEKLHDKREELLCNISLEGLLRNYYLCLNGYNNGLDYFCIWVFEKIPEYTEHRVIDEIKKQCKDFFTSHDQSVNINILNWNDNFNPSSEVFDKKFNISLYSEKNESLFIDNCLDFLVKLDQDFFYKPRKNQRIRREKSEVDFSDIIIQKLKEAPELHNILGDLSKHDLFNLCWSQGHLNDHSKLYLKNIVLQYRESLSLHPSFRVRETDIVLLTKIEIFMLSVKHAQSLQPNDFRARSQQTVERTLFQFVDLLMQHDAIEKLASALGKIYRSRLLNYFFRHYIHNNYHEYLSYPYDHTRVFFFKSELKKFRYLGKLFQNTHRPIAVTLGENKIINIPRHEHRVEKIQDYLRDAFKRDCVLIRCTLGCEMRNGFIKQKGLSAALYQMLHAGKRRAPLSKLRAYVGEWVENDTSHLSDERRFFADIVFVFDREVLNSYPDLGDAISERWNETLIKSGDAFQPSLDLKGSCRVKKIFNSVEELCFSELLLEVIDKPLKNKIINNLVPYIVYRDLLNNTFYSTTPKWLIRGTLPNKKKRKSKSKMLKASI